MIPIRYNLRSIMVRRLTSAAAALGIGLTVFVFASALMLSDGIKDTLQQAGRPDVAIVLRKGSQSEMESSIEENKVGLIMAGPGVRKAATGAADAVGEVVVVAALDKVGIEGVSNVMIRGVPENVMAFRPNVKIVEGRNASSGADEVIVGKRLRGRFKGLQLNESFEIKHNRPVKVVGFFTDNGSSYESEIWGDIEVVRTSFGRDGIVNSVRVHLDSASKIDGFKAAIESDKQLAMEVTAEPAFYEHQSEATSLFISMMGAMVAVFFSMGAMIGATITMYAAVANRQKEIGTLKALGFSKPAILFSFLFEAVALTLAGGLIGTIASLGMGFVEFSMVNFVSWSEIVFAFHPTPQIILTALFFASFMGLMGGFLPAIRAARLSPLAAIRGH